MCKTAINMEQRTVTIKNFSRITDPDIHYRRMTYPPERGDNTNVEWGLQKYNINGNNIIVLRTSHSNETLDGLSIYSDGKLSFLLHSHPKNSYSYNASGDYEAYNKIRDNGKIDGNYFDGDLIHLNNLYLRYQKSYPSYPLSKYPKAFVYYAGDSNVVPHIFEYNLKRSRIKPLNISIPSQIFNYIKK